MYGAEESKNMRWGEESKNMGWDEAGEKPKKSSIFATFYSFFSFSPLPHLLKTLNKKLLPSRKLDLRAKGVGLLLVP